MIIKSRKDLEEVLENGLVLQNLICVTHNGVFHADEVFCTAFFMMFQAYFRLNTPSHRFPLRFNDVSFIRTPNPKQTIEEKQKLINENTHFIVFDIGGAEFDHHQQGSPVRASSTAEDPQPYAAFGLVWREFGPLIFDEDFISMFDDLFVKHIDLQDNGISLNPLSGTITRMNPDWDSHEIPDLQFRVAVGFAEQVLRCWFDQYFSTRRAEVALEECVSTPVRLGGRPDILILAKYMPYQKYLMAKHPEITHVIYPSARSAGEWCISPVNSKEVFLPESWVSGENKPEGMTFCHKARFIASFTSTKEAFDAIVKELDSHE